MQKNQRNNKPIKTELFIYFSEILGKRVLDAQGKFLGTLHDISMSLNSEVYPKATDIIIKKGLFKKKYAMISFPDIDKCNNVFQLKIGKDKVSFQSKPCKSSFTLARDILDQQVVDTDNQKVVRVNDVHLLKLDTQLFFAHVDVGTRGIVRRLGWTPFIDGIVKLLSSRSPYLTQEEFIPWKNTQVLTLGRSKNVLRLDVSRQKMANIPPTDLAEIMQDLDIFEKLSLFKSLDIPIQRKVFTDLPIPDKEELVDQLKDRETVNLLENIPADEATDLLLSLPKQDTRRLMRLMDVQVAKKLRKLLGFEKDTAGGLMTTEYLALKGDAFVEDALEKIKQNTQYPGNIFFVYIVDDEHHLIGTTSLRRFINEKPKTLLKDTCYPKDIFVHPDDGVEEIALLLEKYKFSSIPVLDEKEVLQGVITIDDVMEELISLVWAKYKEKL